MLGERINEIYLIEKYPILSIIITTDNGHYLIEGNESYFRLPKFSAEKGSDLPKEFKGMIINDVISDGEMLVIVLENNYYISRAWSFVTGDGQVSQDVSFHKDFNDLYDFINNHEVKENGGLYSLTNVG